MVDASFAADKILTIKTKGSHQGIAFDLMKFGKFGYIVYAYGPAKSSTNQIMSQRIKWSAKKNAWRLSGKPTPVNTSSVSPAGDKIVSHPDALCIEKGRFRVDVVWTGIEQETYSTEYNTLDKKGKSSSNPQVLSTSNQVTTNPQLYQSPAGPLAVYSRRPDDTGVKNTGLIGQRVGPGAPMGEEQVLIPGERTFNADDVLESVTTPYARGSVTGTQCNDGFDQYDFFLGHNTMKKYYIGNKEYEKRGGHTRFKVEPDWKFTQQETFLFNNPSNLETIVKVLDGSGFFTDFWVFAAGTTNVEYNLTVTDTTTGEMNTYQNPLGMPSQAVLDTEAFATCPGPPNVAADAEYKTYAVAYNQKRGRFIVRQMSADGTTMVGKKLKTQKVGPNVRRYKLKLKNDHLLILYVDGDFADNRLRLYDMDLTGK